MLDRFVFHTEKDDIKKANLIRAKNAMGTTLEPSTTPSTTTTSTVKSIIYPASKKDLSSAKYIISN